jgi:N-acetylneuraminate synthase
LFDAIAGRCPVIAEVAQNHDGSLGTAHAYIDAVARAGAAAVKFQTHIAEAESSPDEPWRVKFSRQDATRFDYWKRIEFKEDEWHGLAAHARERGIVFLSSPFSMEAVELLARIGVPAWKVGAGEITNLPMLERMARTGKPVLLSSGMSGWADLDRAVACVRENGAEAVIFQCTTAYPCPPEKLGLNVLAELRERYLCQVGLSDHSGTIYAGLAAAALGADLVEVHVTLSKECFGPDVPASITTAELAQLTEGVNFISRALASPVKKEEMAAELSEMRRIFGKSLVAAADFGAGMQLAESDFRCKKPGTGIAAARLKEFTDRRLKRAVARNQRFSEDDFE